jgi:hypothetical protein
MNPGEKFDHLVLVPGHAVWDLVGDPLADASWNLRDFQRGEPRFYLEHIRRGVILAADDPNALLVFSGGQTSPDSGPCSEALGYWKLAEHFGWWRLIEVRPRAITEEFAGDSLENVLYSICRFREFTGEWPQRISVAGWGFKAERFTDFHRPALRFPCSRFHYLAVNDPEDLAAAEREEAATRARFGEEPYGGAGMLIGKRVERNPFRRQHGYAESCPELRELLSYRGPEVFRGTLPW